MDSIVTITGTEVSLEQARTIIDTALMAGHTHGIGYWAHAKKYDVETATLTLEAYENDPVTMHTIGPKEIAQGILTMLQNPVKADVGGRTIGLIMSGDIDGPTADVIIQLACFGAVLFG